VNGAIGQPAGIILWETKRTKAWSDGWLGKLRDDQRRSGADVALIVSQALPKHVEQFDLVEGVWVAHPRCALPVAVALRQGLIDVSSSRLVQQGQQTKMEQVYHYLTGTKFRQRVDAVVEKFNDMRDDLDKERKFMGVSGPSEKHRFCPCLTPQWAWSAICKRSPARRCRRSRA
jgi:hypothetical protein